jgi:ABC-type sugar transport system substrate-binding protein
MKKRIVALTLILLMVGAAAVFAGGQKEAEGGANVIAPEEELEFIYVSHAPNINVFQTMRAASEDAANAIGNIKVTWMGPDKPDINAQKSILEMAINKNPDAIMTTTNNPDAYDEVVNKAAEKGIPVFTYNIDNPDTKRICYVGQEFISAGHKFARLGIDMLKKRFPNERKYKVAIFTGEAGNYALERRIQGTREILEQDPAIEVIDVYIYSWDQNEAYNIITEVFQKHPDLKGAFGMDAYSEFIGKYVHDKKMNGEVVVGGFDITDQAIEYIKEDSMQFLVGQNTYMQGWMPTILAYMYLVHNKLPPDLVDTGAPVITADNIEDADIAS